MKHATESLSTILARHKDPKRLAGTLLVRSQDRQKNRNLCTLPAHGRIDRLCFSNNSCIYFEQKGDEVICHSSKSHHHNHKANLKFSMPSSTLDQKTHGMKLDEQWTISFERIKFSEDHRHCGPLFLTQSQVIINEISDKEKYIKHRFWFVIFDFRDKEILAQQRIFLSEDRVNYIPKASVSACSEIRKTVFARCPLSLQTPKLTTDRIFYSQNYQVAISLVHQLRIKIEEYRVQWVYKKELDNKAELEKVQIVHISTKEFFMIKAEEGSTNNISQMHLVPLLDSKKNDIVGTQLMLQKNGESSFQTYIFDNRKERNDLVPKNSLLESQGFKIYRNLYNGDYEAIMAYSRLNKSCWNDSDNLLSKQEMSLIIKMTFKAILNSVIFDPLLPTPKLDALSDNQFIRKFKIGRGIELFDWFSLPMIRKESMTKLRELLQQVDLNEDNFQQKHLRILDL